MSNDQTETTENQEEEAVEAQVTDAPEGGENVPSQETEEQTNPTEEPEAEEAGSEEEADDEAEEDELVEEEGEEGLYLTKEELRCLMDYRGKSGHWLNTHMRELNASLAEKGITFAVYSQRQPAKGEDRKIAGYSLTALGEELVETLIIT